ncbi:hypothetical protein JCM5353_003357 [Sporobolomyces roseus]
MGLNSRIGGEQRAWEKRNKAAESSLSKAAEQTDKIDQAKANMMEDWRQEIEAAFFSAQHDYKYFGELKVFSMLENYLDEFQQRIDRTDPITVQTDGEAEIIPGYTARGILQKTHEAHVYLNDFRPATQHSLRKNARVIGRYAAMTGIETGRLSDEGGYYLARH